MITKTLAFLFVLLPIISIFIVALAMLFNCLYQIDNKEKESDDSSLNWSDVLNIGIITALICFVAWVICFFIVEN